MFGGPPRTKAFPPPLVPEPTTDESPWATMTGNVDDSADELRRHFEEEARLADAKGAKGPGKKGRVVKMKGAGPGKGVWGQDDDESFSGISGRGGPVAYGAPIEVGQRGYAAGPGQFGYEAPGHGLGNDPCTPGRYDEYGVWTSPRWWPEQGTGGGWHQATGAGSASARRSSQGVWTSPASSSYGESAYAQSACGSAASARPRAATQPQQQPEYSKG